jgi:PAS domain S-box-containing protein
VAKIAGTEQWFRRMADAAPVLIWICGTDKFRTWFNKPWLDFVGRAMEQELAYGWAENVHPEDRDRCLETFDTGIDARRPFTMEYRLKRYDQEYRWVLDNGIPFDGPGGEFTGYIGFCVDITDQRLAEEECAYARAIIASSDDAILSRTLEGIITSWNPAAERIFGYTAAEARGKPIDIIIPPDRLEEERQILERLRRGEPIERYETVRRAKDGHTFDISLTTSPVKDASGRIIGASKIVRDITDQKRMEEERAGADRRKNEFLAILAHELRNPLGPVRNAAHYLMLKGPTDPDLRRPIEIIDRQVEQMARLVDDLLDVSRISRGVLELRRQRVALAEIVEASVDACREAVQAQGHNLRVSVPIEPVELEADRQRLVQVLTNLISNAAKYTPPGGQIELTAAASDRLLEVAIKDNGIGIPPAKLTEIFDLFTQLDRSFEQQGGLGIGLTLVRQLVELHGGTIAARSEGIGHGSEFALKIPVVATVAAAAAARPAPVPASRPRRILLADDNHDAVESLTLLLEIAGHEVHKAFDGEAAISSAEKLLPEVALLDIGMPKANGYEVARRIREHPWGKQIYLVAITGWGQEADKRRAREAGFDAQLVKPVAPDALNRLLATIGDPPAGSVAP